MQQKQDERVGRLEVSVDVIKTDLEQIRHTLAAIQDIVSQSKQTNWSVLISGAALALMFYAAAIRPLDSDLQRQQSTAVELASAVLVQNDKILEQQINFARIEQILLRQDAEINQIIKNGVPAIDKRMTILEYKMNIK